jgi:protein-ribulosamine 3-kinase
MRTNIRTYTEARETTMIPATIKDDVIAVLRAAGDATPLHDTLAASRGGVSDTLHLLTDQSDYFLKWNETPWFGTFTNEALQLSLLRETNTVRVPVVIGFAEGEEGRPAWMLQEWIGGASEEDERERLGACLGERIAALHRATAGTAPGYGYVERNADGSLRLPTTDWPAFLYEGHWRHHVERARKENRWTPERNARVDRLIARLPDLLDGVNRAPTLLHGDLHGCNVRCAANGEPVIADPWLYYGDREKEIVSTLVSGDFLPTFLEAYIANCPLEPGFAERIDLYKLTWLLSSGYYSSDQASGEDNALADPILKRYVG